MSHTAAAKTPSPIIDAIYDIAGAAARVARLPKVYPAYLAFTAKRALVAATADAEQIIREVGDVETIGDCRYATEVTDHNGTRYRITVEVL